MTFPPTKFRGVLRPMPSDTQLVKTLVAQGWRATWAACFGQEFVDILAPHHIEAIEWHWNSRLAFLTKERPEYLAYFPIWSRGNMKSSVAERIVVVDGILHYAYKEPGYCLYLSKNKDKVQEHIANVEALLASERVRRICPQLSSPQRTEITNQQRRWTSSFLKTEANYAIQGGTLDSGLAGSRVGETRVTLILPDDIDGREDSPVIAETRFRQLTTEILPMRQANTLVFFAQNLISRYSVMYRIQTGQARVLTNRKPAEPIPAVVDLVTEQRTVDGIIKDVYVSGTPSWQAWDIQRIQDEIDTEGLESFLRECQHQVSQTRDEVILYNYHDSVHVISESEFVAKFGSADAWLTWRKKPGNDWARTKTDKHANVAAWMTISPMDSAFPNVRFLMKPHSFPANSSPEDVAEALLSDLSPVAYDKVKWKDLRYELLRGSQAMKHAANDSERLEFERGALSKIIPKYSKPLLQRCNVQQGDMSHEMKTVRQIYSQIYSLGFRGVNPGKHGGTEAINRDMRVDFDEPHAFRPDEMGYTRWYMVVPDDPTNPYTLDGETIFKPKPYPLAVSTNDLWDDDLCRFHFSNCRYRPPKLTESGEQIDEPEKIYDDFFNLMQMLYVGNPLTGSSLTVNQKVDLLIPETAKAAFAQAVTGSEKLNAGLTLEFERELAEAALIPAEDRFEDEYDYV